MDILKRFDGKINGVLETFDRIIINGYIQPFHNFRLFLYYLIQKNVLLKDFDSFARQQTDTLCSHIETYIRDNDSTLTYLNSEQIDKGELARQAYLQKPDKQGLICAFSTVEPCKTITVKPNRESKKLEVTSRLTKCIQVKTWVPMGKSIINLYRYAEISKAIIKRYLAAMPDISLDKVPQKEIMEISRAKEVST